MLINIHEIKNKLKKDLKENKGFERILIQCFKKDREIIIELSINGYIITENGYKKQTIAINNYKECLKQIAKLICYEFNNSNKLWYYKK